MPPPTTAIRRPPRPRPSAPSARLPWGWLEWVMLSQTLIPALLFIPGLSPIRTATRIAAYLIAPTAWGYFLLSGKSRPGAGSFPARPWLIFCAVWLGLMIFHPNSHTLLAATAQVAMYVAIFSPAFWAPSALVSSRQIGRLTAILFLCNAISALVGVGQVYRPNLFNPPYIPALNNVFQGEDLMYQLADGRRILRPCGLTDTPGGASPAGQAAALLGLCWALRPIRLWKRIASAGLAFVGVAVIYFSQVRTPLVMLAICIAALTGLFFLQRKVREATLLMTGGVGLIAMGLLWALRSGGDIIFQRFATLWTADPVKLYNSSHGGFVQEALSETVFKYPLGYGLGWWGMIYAMFGNKSVPSMIWVEVMVPAWIYDGGIPLLIAYVAAIGLAFYDSTRIALTSRDPDLAFWAAVIVAYELSILAMTLSYPTFLAPIGLQFWLLASALHAADIRSRSTPRPKPIPR